MNETTLLTEATEAELIEAIGALWAKDYLANNEPAEVAEYVYDVNRGSGDMFEDDNRESQEDLWQAVHEEFFTAVAGTPEIAALVEKMEADDAENRPATDWLTEISHARYDLARAEDELTKANAKLTESERAVPTLDAKFSTDKRQIHRVYTENRVDHCRARLQMAIDAAVRSGVDPNDEVEF